MKRGALEFGWAVQSVEPPGGAEAVEILAVVREM